VVPLEGNVVSVLASSAQRPVALRLAAMGLVIVALFGVGGWLLLTSAGAGAKLEGGAVFGIGTGMLALTLGMRHAFDADHISAIDNTTRQIIARGRRPVSVGFFFSLGHSSVVLVLTIFIYLGVGAIGPELSEHGSMLNQISSVVGTAVSGVFLYLIAGLNVVVLISLIRAFGRARRGQFDRDGFDLQLRRRSVMGRILERFSGGVDRSWKIYPIGILFGLGFDTATEVGLLVLSGGAVASGLSFTAVISLPLLFAAGMCVFDTIDGIFMNISYGWASDQPVRRVYYNAVVTGLSVVVAVAIGTAEILGLVGTQLGLGGQFWRGIENLDLNSVGYVVVALFVAVWVIALFLWKALRIGGQRAVHSV
jgi:high-affinity nickel-transport protein